MLSEFSAAMLELLIVGSWTEVSMALLDKK
jgi:hypothetical protein